MDLVESESDGELEVEGREAVFGVYYMRVEFSIKKY